VAEEPVPQAELETTPHGLVPRGEGWFVLNAREASWRAGEGRGARDLSTGPDWGAYPVDEVALRRGAGVEQETTDAKVAYAPVARRELTAYREGWVPD
jgi:hypothetical protein